VGCYKKAGVGEGWEELSREGLQNAKRKGQQEETFAMFLQALSAASGPQLGLGVKRQERTRGGAGTPRKRLDALQTGTVLGRRVMSGSVRGSISGPQPMDQGRQYGTRMSHLSSVI